MQNNYKKVCNIKTSVLYLSCAKKHKTLKTENMKNLTTQLQDVYLNAKQFDADLETCLTIIKYPSSKHPYYVCEHISAALIKRNLNIYIKN